MNFFSLKTKIISGKNCLKHLSDLTQKNALIINDQAMKDLGYLDTCIDLLKKSNISYRVFSDVCPDPHVGIIANGLKSYWEQQPDLLIAIGGGSAIDAAKAILYAAHKVKEFSKPYFVAIPSTSGTGSEVTDFSVITTGDEKIVVIDEFIAPDLALLDSDITKLLPKPIIADTGLDVLVHALEAYVSNKANDFTDALAEKAVKLIFKYLLQFYHQPNCEVAREKILNASCLAGIAFNNAGLGINHSLAHAVGGRFGIPHGRINGILCDHVIQFNAGRECKNLASQKYAHLAKELGLPSRTVREGVYILIKEIQLLKSNLKLEERLRELQISEQDYCAHVEKMAQTAFADQCTPTNPIEPSVEDLTNIYKKIY